MLSALPPGASLGLSAVNAITRCSLASLLKFNLCLKHMVKLVGLLGIVSLHQSSY